MIKRLVILQDEQMLIRELRAAASRAAVYIPSLTGVGVPVAAAAAAPHGPVGGYQPPPPVEPPLPHPSPLSEVDFETGGEPAVAKGPAPEEPRTLADIARAAALKAERAALEQTLDAVRWNRRKAAQQLGVSYKTLLNKIKECGISQK
jgi:DNA-binding NtrC family response regulator